MKNKKIHQPHDKGYKYILKIKKEFINLLKGFVKEQWVDSVTEKHIVRIDKSFIDSHFQGKEADIVYQYRNGEKETIFYILLEHQSTSDKKMMFRLLLYMIEIWRDYLNEKKLTLLPETNDTKKVDFKIPAIIPIVLYTGTSHWHDPKSFKEIIYNASQFEKQSLDFEALFIDISIIDDEDFLRQESVISLAMYMDKVRTLKEFLKKFRIVRLIYNKLNMREKRMLTKWTKEILLERFNETTRETIENILDEENPKEVNIMITNLERVIEREFQEKYMEGKIEGKFEGKIEGKIEDAKQMLSEGLSLSLIQKITQLSLEQIQDIQADLKTE